MNFRGNSCVFAAQIASRQHGVVESMWGIATAALAGYRCSHPLLGDCSLSLQFGVDTAVSSNDVRVLRVTLSSDLTMDKHFSKVCSAGFYRLRQLWRVRRSLDSESAATLIHAFVTSRIDYCNVLLAGAPKATADKLQRLLNTAACLVSDTRKSVFVLQVKCILDYSALRLSA